MCGSSHSVTKDLLFYPFVRCFSYQFIVVIGYDIFVFSQHINSVRALIYLAF